MRAVYWLVLVQVCASSQARTSASSYRMGACFSFPILMNLGPLPFKRQISRVLGLILRMAAASALVRRLTAVFMRQVLELACRACVSNRVQRQADACRHLCGDLPVGMGSPGPGGLSPLLHRLVSLEFASWARPSEALIPDPYCTAQALTCFTLAQRRSPMLDNFPVD